MQALILILYAISGLTIVYGIVLSVESTLHKAQGLPVPFKFLGLALRLFGLAVLCFLILKYKGHHLINGLFIFFISAVLTLFYFLLVRRSSMR